MAQSESSPYSHMLSSDTRSNPMFDAIITIAEVVYEERDCTGGFTSKSTNGAAPAAAHVNMTREMLRRLVPP